MFDRLMFWLEVATGISTVAALVLMITLYWWTSRHDDERGEEKSAADRLRK